MHVPLAEITSNLRAEFSIKKFFFIFTDYSKKSKNLKKDFGSFSCLANRIELKTSFKRFALCPKITHFHKKNSMRISRVLKKDAHILSIRGGGGGCYKQHTYM